MVPLNRYHQARIIFVADTPATPNEVRQAVLEDAKSGISERQDGDFRVKSHPLLDRLRAVKEVESATRSPFIRVGFKKRSF